MDLGLKRKTAVVSGSTAGIGLAIAAALASEGASVVVNGRTEARVAAAVEQIRRRVKDDQDSAGVGGAGLGGITGRHRDYGKLNPGGADGLRGRGILRTRRCQAAGRDSRSGREGIL